MVRWLFANLLVLVFVSPSFGAYSFPGTTLNGLNFGRPGKLANLPEMTISMWFYARGYGANGNANSCLIAKANDTDADHGIWIVRVDNTGAVRFIKFWAFGFNLQAISNTAFSLGQWTHLAITWDGGLLQTGVNFYVNGINVGRAGGGTDGTAKEQFDNNENFFIGDIGNGTRTWDGFIDETAVWNTVLSEGEIKLLALSRTKRLPLQVRAENLRFYTPLDDHQFSSPTGSSQTVRDLSPSTGTANGWHMGGGVGTIGGVLSYP